MQQISLITVLVMMLIVLPMGAMEEIQVQIKEAVARMKMEFQEEEAWAKIDLQKAVYSGDSKKFEDLNEQYPLKQDPELAGHLLYVAARDWVQARSTGSDGTGPYAVFYAIKEHVKSMEIGFAQRGYTALHVACLKKELLTVKFLIESEANPCVPVLDIAALYKDVLHEETTEKGCRCTYEIIPNESAYSELRGLVQDKIKEIRTYQFK